MPVSEQAFAVVLVYSTGHALKAEKLLLAAGHPCKLVPVPRHLSSDCGVCVRIPAEASDTVADLLARAGIETEGIWRMQPPGAPAPRA